MGPGTSSERRILTWLAHCCLFDSFLLQIDQWTGSVGSAKRGRPCGETFVGSATSSKKCTNGTLVEKSRRALHWDPWACRRPAWSTKMEVRQTRKVDEDMQSKSWSTCSRSACSAARLRLQQTSDLDIALDFSTTSPSFESPAIQRLGRTRYYRGESVRCAYKRTSNA